MASPSQVPVRYPSGVSTDYPWGPLGNFGLPNPFFYNVWPDDFDGFLEVDTYTKTTTGTIANTPGDGGLVLFTTAATAAAVAFLQVATANFVLPPPIYSGSGQVFPSKKLFYLTRVQVSDAVNNAIYAGLVNITGTVAGITDGIYFVKASGAALFNLVIISGSVVQATIPIPAAATNLANNTFIDLGFYVDRLTNVYAFAGFPMVGWVPASAWTGVNNVNAAPPPLGAVAAYQTGVSGQLTLSTANLAPLLGLVTGNSLAVTMTADFLLTAKER
jgi:hypothetical protein